MQERQALKWFQFSGNCSVPIKKISNKTQILFGGWGPSDKHIPICVSFISFVSVLLSVQP